MFDFEKAHPVLFDSENAHPVLFDFEKAHPVLFDSEKAHPVLFDFEKAAQGYCSRVPVQGRARLERWKRFWRDAKRESVATAAAAAAAAAAGEGQRGCTDRKLLWCNAEDHEQKMNKEEGEQKE